VPNMFGGLKIRTGFVKDQLRVRLVVNQSLAVGDLIIVAYDSESWVYVYVGNDTFIYTESGDLDTNRVKSKNGMRDVMTQLIAFDKFAVLRPSMIYGTAE